MDIAARHGAVRPHPYLQNVRGTTPHAVTPGAAAFADPLLFFSLFPSFFDFDSMDFRIVARGALDLARIPHLIGCRSGGRNPSAAKSKHYCLQPDIEKRCCASACELSRSNAKVANGFAISVSDAFAAPAFHTALIDLAVELRNRGLTGVLRSLTGAVVISGNG
jgi:hypothetical protein